VLAKKQILTMALAGVLALGAAAFGVAHWVGLARFGGDINAQNVDLAKPDALIRTPALSKLPRDLVRAPVLRELLSSDFAFFYETHEDRLGVLGAVKRLAFEHNVSLSDQVLAWALDEPAEMAFWADAKGAPRHWCLTMTRGALAKALEALSPLAAKDAQLSLIDTVHIHGSKVPVLALQLTPRRTLLFASLGNRVMVLSDPGLLFDAERKVDSRSLAVVGKLLSGNTAEQTIFSNAFGLGADVGQHTLVADAHWVSQGYQHFFPGLQAVRLDVPPGGSSLRTALRTSAAAALPAGAQAAALWRGVPANAAACAVLPTDAERLKALGTEQPEAIQKVLAQLQGPAAVCWYARSQLHTPVLVAQTRAGPPLSSEHLQAVWQWLMPKKAAPRPDGPQAAQRWQAQVAAPWGPLVGGIGEDEANAQYRPALAQQGNWLSFSPDGELVTLAQRTQSQRFPSVAETVEGSAPVAVISPKWLADMAQAEAFAVLPARQELLQQAARQHLLPRLAALRQMPPVRVVPQGARDAQGWQPLAWQAVPAAAPGAP